MFRTKMLCNAGRSKRVNSSRAADEDPTLIAIEAGVATPDEISAAANYFKR
jgi:hypothetical protein